MKLLTIVLTSVLVVCFLTANNAAQAQTTEQSAHVWVNSKAWANGLSLNVAPSVNVQEFYKQYQANKAVWDKVFQFLKDNNLDTL